MTVQELILGHYDGTLAPDEESRLSQMLEESPEVRTMYEQHGTLHSMMEAEAATLAPSRTLRDATIGAALSLVTSTIGGSIIGGWLTGKVAGIISLVIVGGIATGIILNEVDDSGAEGVRPATTVEQPAVTAPSPNELPPPVVDEGPGAEEAAGLPNGTGQPEQRVGKSAEQRRTSDPATDRAEDDIPFMDMNDTNAPTIEHEVKVKTGDPE